MASLAHAVDHGTCAVENPHDVDVEKGSPVVGGRLPEGEGTHGGRDAGVVDQHVDRGDGSERCGHGLEVGDIEGERKRSFAQIRRCDHRPVGFKVVDVDVRARIDQHPGDAEADTPARAGDENSAIGEVEHEPAP